MPHDQRFSVQAELDRIIQNRTIPNALLFTGLAGAGKAGAARYFAMAVNCRGESDPPCGRCPACKKIFNNIHPDMVRVSLPDKKKNISISQIREMEAAIMVKPNEARQRMVLITDADLMNVQAQNALLKSLEEPSRNTFFILIASDLSGLLDTIVSRCRHFRFKALTGRALVQHLVDTHGADARDARTAAETAGEDLDKALMYLDGWQARRKWIVREFTGLIADRSGNTTHKALVLARMLTRDGGAAVLDGVAVIRTVLRDFCVFRYSPEKIVNLDFSGTFQDINQMVDEDTSLKWITDLHETERRLQSNSAARLCLERFFMGLLMT